MTKPSLPRRLLERITRPFRKRASETRSEVEEFLRRVKRDFKKKRFVDPRTDRLDLRYNPLANDEDINIAIRHDPHPAWFADEDRHEIDENLKLDERYNPFANDEDFFIPVRTA